LNRQPSPSISGDIHSSVTTLRYTFAGQTGYLITPQNAGHALLALRHSAGVDPWQDTGLHFHSVAEEYYLLLQGELDFIISNHLLKLRPRQVLLIWPGIPHAVAGGQGPIEHFVLRAPAPEDRQSTGGLPSLLAPLPDWEPGFLQEKWGTRIPLEEPHHQNCWLFGSGSARITTRHLALAYLDFATHEAANAGIGTRHRLHWHRKAWEYYAVFAGSKTLQIEDEMVTIRPGEILAVPPGTRHTLASRQAPYRGMTFRVPLPESDDKVED